MNILVVNCGSSSIKFQLYEITQRRVLAKGHIERIGEQGSALETDFGNGLLRSEQAIADHETGMQLILDGLTSETGPLNDIRDVAAVGHRVVHGGEEFTGSVLIDEQVLDSIEQCADLAPLHNPANLTGIRNHSELAGRSPGGMFRHGLSCHAAPARVPLRLAIRDLYATSDSQVWISRYIPSLRRGPSRRDVG